MAHQAEVKLTKDPDRKGWFQGECTECGAVRKAASKNVAADMTAGHIYAKHGLHPGSIQIHDNT